MAGFGGWGGYAYPTRDALSANPNSGVVQSDQEFNDAWRAKIAATPQYEAGAAIGMSTPWWQGANINNLSAGAAPENARAASETEKLANGYGLTLTRMADGTVQLGKAADIEMQYAPASINPEWQKLTDDFANATAQRGENQIRQQQAYDTGLMGNGAIGGVLPAGYRDPNYGQVTGQAAGSRVGGLGGLGGVNLDGLADPNQSGAYYGGQGAYNPSPWSPENYGKNTGWGGF